MQVRLAGVGFHLKAVFEAVRLTEIISVHEIRRAAVEGGGSG
jgi:hypothetical protein